VPGWTGKAGSEERVKTWTGAEVKDVVTLEEVFIRIERREPVAERTGFNAAAATGAPHPSPRFADSGTCASSVSVYPMVVLTFVA
jgi:hypothetical protein